MAFQSFRVQLKGDDPVVVDTNARDMVSVVMDPNNPRPLDLMFHQIHNAMLRQQMSVPRDFVGFLEALEGMPEAVDPDTDALDPTQPDPSDEPRWPSPSA